MRRISHEDYLTRVKDVLGEEYSVLEEYLNQKQKILVRHNTCGRVYRTTAGNFMLGHGCAECYKKEKLGKARRLSPEEYATIVGKHENGPFELVELYYKSGKSRVKVKHLICGTHSDMTLHNFKNSCGCSYCAEIQRRASKKKTTEQFKADLYQLRGDEFSVVSDYVRADRPITIKHNICGKEFDSTPTHMLDKTRKCCPFCAHISRAESKALTNEQFLERLHEKWGNEYTPLDEYKRNNIKIRLKHNICGHVYKVVPSSVLLGYGCPKCCLLDSKACKRIEDFLIKSGFDFAREFKIQECRNRYPLPFDFAVLNKDKIILLIEYDGEQHFKPIKFFGGEKDFEIRKKRDKIKEDYCKSNNLRLLRINYTQENEIEKILERELR
ncbi:hypothetical protein [Brevibacillus borstelensis]|uniref:hypothetical protein n=1 Tax=Brevibacillus borstelensis TaxID=45462 RepID=UPI00287F9507|nr:hypothetical protein [Brevibacillus borstelensis]WNF07264.1 hypothetical protein RFB14_07500 [Brevibacillus borstelensis]